MTSLADIEKLIEALPPQGDEVVTEGQLREILDLLLEHIKELEERVNAPPVKPAKRP